MSLLRNPEAHRRWAQAQPDHSPAFTQLQALLMDEAALEGNAAQARQALGQYREQLRSVQDQLTDRERFMLAERASDLLRVVISSDPS